MQIDFKDEGLKAKLNAIPEDHENWFARWSQICLSHPEIKAAINNKIAELREQGWIVVEVNLDNHGKGVLVGFQVEKRIPLS